MKIIEDSNDSFKHHSITSSPNRRGKSPSDHKFYNRSPFNYFKTRSRLLYPSSSRSERKYNSRLRSNSYSGDRHRSYRSHSQDSSTKSSRHDGRSRSLNIFGLNYRTKTHQLFNVFKKYGSIDRINVVVDETGKSRGFGFAVFKSYKDSEEALKKCSGMEIDGKKILVEFSTLRRSPTPIPGISMDDLDITATWRRAYEERYHKDRKNYRRNRNSSTYKKKSHKDRSRSHSWPLHWA
ncbi:transformer-2 sex-determining protein-like [Metopolophium dirhodum]|uniref:transformer-2 sex-determining protein-like n=1 Tax=Metopolophium dirhodum TaxID=44670 RepID=UPI0029906618|nr:transformer-2 sex-determining protein-like [Metopolophium dirhodum]